MNRTNKIIKKDLGIKKEISSHIKYNSQEQRIPQTPQEIDDFIAHNKWIMHAVAKPYRGLMEYEDLFQEACVGMVKGLSTFSLDKGVKLTTYVYACAANEVKMAIRKNGAKKRSATIIPIDFVSADHMTDISKPLAIPDPNIDVEKDAIEKVLYNKIIEVIKTKLTTIEQIVVIQYRDGVSQSKTAKYLRISQSQVSKILNRALCKIKSEIDHIDINL